METTLTIKGIEEKTSAKGRNYFIFDTSQGKMSCFESSIVDVLKKKVGEDVNIDFVEKDGFKNIKKILANVSPQAVKVPEQKEEAFKEAREAKNQSIYTSYAKDIFIEIAKESGLEDYEKLMKTSIALVHQAKKAFE